MVYSFYPFIIVSQLAIFTLTLLEGLLLAIPAFGGILLLGVITGAAVALYRARESGRDRVELAKR